MKGVIIFAMFLGVLIAAGMVLMIQAKIGQKMFSRKKNKEINK